jgi:hypothetical protein
VALVLATAASGCGGGDDSRPKGTLEETLSYVPAEAGLVAIVPTDLDHGPLHDLDVLASRFDRWDEVKRELESRIGNGGLAFDDVVLPQLGNLLAVAFVNEQRQISVIRLQDPDALRRTIEREIALHAATRLPDRDGAFVWRQAGRRQLSFNAIAEGHLISASNARDLGIAIDAHRGDSAGTDAATVEELERLDEGALVRITGDVHKLLAEGDPAEAAELRRVRWIDALGRFRGTAHVGEHDVTAAIRVDSSRKRLTKRDLPLAPGARSPLLHETGAAALALGVLEPDRLVRLLEPVLEITSPDDYADYKSALATLRTGYGIDIHRDLLARMKSLSVAVWSATALSFKADLEPGAGRQVGKVLARAAPFIEDTLRERKLAGAVRSQGGGGGRRWILKRGPITVGQYGVRGDTLVGAFGFATLPGTGPGRRLPGANGSLSLRAHVGRITGILNPGKLPIDIPITEALAILSQLGNLTLSVRTETTGVTARARVEVAGPGQ